MLVLPMTFARIAEAINRKLREIHGRSILALVLVKNANRMMTAAGLTDEGIHLCFADGSNGVIPFGDLPEIKFRSEIRDIELPSTYEMIVESIHGERVEVPWDFARHYCDGSYRPSIEAIAANCRPKNSRRTTHCER